MGKPHTIFELKCRYCFKIAWFLFSILLTICLADELQAQSASFIVESISFSGIQHFTEKTLLETAGIVIPGSYTNEQMQKHLEKIVLFYQKNGYLYAQIDTAIVKPNEQAGRVSISVFVNEGNLFIIDSITITGATAGEITHFKQTMPSAGTPFDTIVVTAFIGGIIHYYEENGFPYASVTIDSIRYTFDVSKHQTNASLVLHIKRNKSVTLDSIAVNGLIATQYETFIRESRLHIVEPYSRTRILRAVEYIQKLPYFSEVGIPELYELGSGESLLQFSVKEKPSMRFNGIIGYNPSSPQQKGSMVGSFMIESVNLFGTGREFHTDWNKMDKTSQSVTIYYQEPWVFKVPLKMQGQFEQIINDSTYVKRVFSIGAAYSLNQQFSVQARFGREQVIAEPVGVQKNSLSSTNGVFYTIGLSYDNLDYRLNPSSGVCYSTTLTRQNRTNVDNLSTQGKENVTDKKIIADGEVALPVTRKTVVSIHGVWNQTASTEPVIPMSQRWYLGGARSLRGYREKQFLASTVSFLNLEFRYLLSRDSRLFVFLDGGYFQNKGGTVNKKYSYGFGMQIDAPIGIVGITMGLGAQESISSAKIHLVLQSAF